MKSGEKFVSRYLKDEKSSWELEQIFFFKINRPFPSSPVPLFQNESRYETIHMKRTLICMKMKLQVELSFALRLVLKQRHKITRKWPIKLG